MRNTGRDPDVLAGYRGPVIICLSKAIEMLVAAPARIWLCMDVSETRY